MKREERYLVFKYTDLHDLDTYYQNNLADIISEVNGKRAARGKASINCVVIESDWPEYEVVWKLLEKRVDNENTAA